MTTVDGDMGGEMGLSIEIDDDLQRRIASLSGLRELSPESILREALTQFVTREEARESFKADALASLAAYEADGLHLDGADMAAWLDTWGTEAETEMPECHV